MIKKLFLLIPLLLCFSLSNAQLLTESDKQKHFAAGSVIGSLAYGIVLEESQDKKTAFIASVAAAFAAGYLKETMDKKNGYEFDNRDLLASTYGGLTIGITLDIFAKDGKKGKGIFNFRKKKKRN